MLLLCSVFYTVIKVKLRQKMLHKLEINCNVALINKWCCAISTVLYYLQCMISII